MMKHSTHFPPNWEKIRDSIFGGSPGLWQHHWQKGLIVTWGETYHCKDDLSLQSEETIDFLYSLLIK